MEEQRAGAGWYPIEGGKLRYWNGHAWTEHVHHPVPEHPAVPRGAATKLPTSRLRSAASAATAHLTSSEQDLPDGTLWSAIGKNLGKLTTGRYRLDPVYLYFSKGALRTEWQQVYVASIVDVDVRQSVTQKPRAVYTVIVRQQNGIMFTLDDIPDGPAAQRIITKAGVDARLALEQRSIRIEAQRHDVTNTVRQEIKVESSAGRTIQPQTVAGVVVPRAESTPSLSTVDSESERAALAAAAGNTESGSSPIDAPDYIVQLRELGKLRDDGVLTDAEFAGSSQMTV